MVLLSENETNKTNSKAEDMHPCVLVCVCVCETREPMCCALEFQSSSLVSSRLRAWTGKTLPYRGCRRQTPMCRKGNKRGDTFILMCLLVYLVVCVCQWEYLDQVFVAVLCVSVPALVFLLR